MPPFCCCRPSTFPAWSTICTWTRRSSSVSAANWSEAAKIRSRSVLQSRDLVHQRFPVQLLPGHVTVETGERKEAAGDGRFSLFQPLNRRRHTRLSPEEGLGKADHGVDLLLVGPAEDVLPAVVDPVAVVLLVAVPVLDLSGPRHRLGGGAEVGDGVDAGVVRPPPQLGFQPGLETGAGLDLEHVGKQRITRPPVPYSRSHRRGWDPVVHDTGPEVAVVDPGGDGLVVAVGYKHREGEVVQHTFGRALPVGGVGPYLEQLAGEGKLVGVDVDIRAQAGPQLQAAAGQVGGTGLEAAQLGVDRRGVVLDLAQLDLSVGDLVLYL